MTALRCRHGVLSRPGDCNRCLQDAKDAAAREMLAAAGVDVGRLVDSRQRAKNKAKAEKRKEQRRRAKAALARN